MGKIAALISKKESTVSDKIIKMIEPESSSFIDSYGFASNGNVEIFSDLRPSNFQNNLILSYLTRKIVPNDPLQPTSQNGLSFVFEGRLWDKFKPSDHLFIGNTIWLQPLKGMLDLVDRINGSYIVIAEDGKRIIINRDPVGVVPLYYGENKSYVGLASNKKMLWAIGLKANNFPCGHIGEFSCKGVHIRKVRGIKQNHILDITMKEAVNKLNELLCKVVQLYLKNLTKCTLGFSGGVDSTLLAYYLKNSGVKPGLICVGLEDSKDFLSAESAAESLQLPIQLESFTQEDVEEDIDNALFCVEQPDPIKICVAIPILWAARVTSKTNSKVLFLGNGTDELFGGYQKYVKQYALYGEKVASECLFNDVVLSSQKNYERDFKICSDFGLELRLPFADMRVVDFGLSIPLKFKISDNQNSQKKLILRAVAEKLGFPEEIVYRPKKAVQYSTGVTKVLKKLAKKEGVSLSKYLLKRFENLKKIF